MASSDKVSADKEGKGATPLSEFMTALNEFVATSLELGAKQAGDDDTRQIITANAEILAAHIKGLASFASEQYEALNDGQRADVDKVVTTMNAAATARSGTAFAQKRFSLVKSWKSFLSWLSQHLRELKKLLHFILDFILGLFGMTVPSWVTSLELLIDQIFDFLMSLIGGGKGENQARFAAELSGAEVNYWNEMAAVVSFNQVVRGAKHAQVED